MTPEDAHHVSRLEERIKLLERDNTVLQDHSDQCVAAVRTLIDQVNALADRLNGHLADQKETAPARDSVEFWQRF